MTPPAFHIPVLCQEAVEALVTDPGGTYVDGTMGGGGHAEAICARLSGSGLLIGLDADEDALTEARARLARAGNRVLFMHANFGDLSPVLDEAGIGFFHGLLLDLGVSSHQLDAPVRGFSFREDEPLDMRLDRRAPFTARDLVNERSEQELAEILWRYGEERHARRIARRLISARPVETTGALRDVVASVVGRQFLNKSLARVFQALRIEVNAELENLKRVLPGALPRLHPGGRIVVIAYHSLEDRIVKEFFRSASTPPESQYPALLPQPTVEVPLRVLTRKPVVPAETEAALNPRARSAKMRVAEKISCGKKT
jgi:16S rRNA (cytosine1402-N4)-methyltransferase